MRGDIKLSKSLRLRGSSVLYLKGITDKKECCIGYWDGKTFERQFPKNLNYKVPMHRKLVLAMQNQAEFKLSTAI